MGEYLYTVEHGRYSDHRVMCVVHTKAEAKEIVALYNNDDDSYEAAYVGQLPLVERPFEKVTTYRINADVWDDGRVEQRGDLMSRDEWDFDLLDPRDAMPVHWRWVRAPIHGGKGGWLSVNGTDLERVRRVFSDRKAQLLADPVFRNKREVQG